MKKLFYLFAALLTVALVGCNKGEEAKEAEPEAIKLSVTPNEIICPDMGGDYTLSLTAPDSWTAECSDNWIKIDPMSGKAGSVELSVRISANTESSESSSQIVFKSGNETLNLKVKRAAKAPAHLRIISEKEVYASKDGGDYALLVESNIKWMVSSNASWAKVKSGSAVKQNNDDLMITVDPATTPNEGTAQIVISPYGGGYEAGNDTLFITRAGTEASSLKVMTTTISMPSSGGHGTIKVEADCKWRATKTWDMDWLTLSDAEGNGNGEFKYTASEATSTNTMRGVITVQEVRNDDYPPVTGQVLIAVRGKAEATLSVDPLRIDAPSEGGVYAVKIECNYDWTAESTASKIATLSAKSGSKNGTLVVTVKPATDENEATCKVVIWSSFGSEKAEVNIRRAGKDKELSPVPAAFSVAENKKVYFSKGNLQYNPWSQEWRFAPNQYDRIGKDNEKINYSYKGWIDLFGYGTSGEHYKPYDWIGKGSNYASAGIEGTDHDWGVWLTKQNALPTDATIAGKEGSGKWRTLTTEEWAYLIHTRSESLIGYGTITNYDGNGGKVKGFIILPDNFAPATELHFVSAEKAKGSIPWRIGKFDSNAMSRSIWAEYEKAGAVFLPACGYRYDHSETCVWVEDESNFYWTSTRGDIEANRAKVFGFYPYKDDYSYVDYYYCIPGDQTPRWNGCAVRLVQDIK